MDTSPTQRLVSDLLETYHARAIAREIGVSRAAVWSWKRGERRPSMDNLVKLCRLAGASLDDVLGEGSP